MNNTSVVLISFYYDEYENIMVTEEGDPMLDIFRIIPPWRFLLLMKQRGTIYVAHPDPRYMYELVFPLHGEDF